MCYNSSNIRPGKNNDFEEVLVMNLFNKDNNTMYKNFNYKGYDFTLFVIKYKEEYQAYLVMNNTQLVRWLGFIADAEDYASFYMDWWTESICYYDEFADTQDGTTLYMPCNSMIIEYETQGMLQICATDKYNALTNA
jgi:hypothetical protein